jgi:hypothetical protein
MSLDQKFNICQLHMCVYIFCFILNIYYSGKDKQKLNFMNYK